MKDSLIIEGKIYISARRAAKLMNYAQDYVGQLCRQGKVESKMIGRSWFVTEESLVSHRESAVDATMERVSKASLSSLTSEALLANLTSPIFSTVPPTHLPPVKTNFLLAGSVKSAPEIKKSEISLETLVLKYETEKSPSIPELLSKKFFVEPKLSPGFSSTSISSMYSTLSTPTLSRNSFLSIVLVTALAVSGFILSSTSISNTVNKNSSQASLSSLPQQIANNVIRGFKGISDIFVSSQPEPVKPTENTAPAISPTTSPASGENLANNVNNNAKSSTTNGIVVAPSKKSTTDDESLTQKIRNSFSDEVSIHPDQSGTAGVITPLFKKTDKVDGINDFLYVLVPVEKKQNDKATSTSR